MNSNLLHLETSPYLLQHKDNPVHWMPWGTEAFDIAKRDDKPVLLSVGYAACHWCHVMAHESFEDPETAELMNALYVNIKVDREERPDIDKIYMTALQRMGEQGGWPMTMVLAPDGSPFWGGTYFPKEPRYGRPGFRQVLAEIARIYRDERAKVDHNARALRDALNAVRQYETAADLSIGILDRIADQVLTIMDPSDGGLQGAPKFPQTGLFELLWRAGLRGGRDTHMASVINTLTHICQGGIYDHLGGGFARYSVDHRWLAPHFEKMLYDNAQLVGLMTLGWQRTGDPLLKARIEETAGWLEREMIAESGGFAASLDADSEGEEGRFYVWSAGEIRDILEPDEAELFFRIYDVSDGGNWEGRTILNRLDHLDLLDEDTEAVLAAARRKLLARRATRIRPGWDDKVLTDWNGLMIAALANASAALAEPAWLATAVRAFAAIETGMIEDDHLMHSLRLGRVRHFATAEGYANMIGAALVLHEVTAKTAYLERARTWAEEMHRHFWDMDRGGYYFTSERTEALIVRIRTASDDATPNANATMLGNFARLHAMTGEETYRARGEALIAAFQDEILANIHAHATFFNAFEIWLEPVHCVLCGDESDPAWRALVDAVLRRPIPNRCLSHVRDAAELPPNHPAHGKTLLDGKPTLYVCRGTTCSLPVTDPDGLDRLEGFL
jgi:uncharacterized protein YyaL (SSP411 family)